MQLFCSSATSPRGMAFHAHAFASFRVLRGLTSVVHHHRPPIPLPEILRRAE